VVWLDDTGAKTNADTYSIISLWPVGDIALICAARATEQTVYDIRVNGLFFGFHGYRGSRALKAGGWPEQDGGPLTKSLN
jgi:hypothetical protein